MELSQSSMTEPIFQTNTNPTDKFRALNNETRREILKMICDSRPGGTTFSEIWSHYKSIKDERTGKDRYSKPNISQHIRELLLAELIIARKEGGFRRYFPHDANIGVFADYARVLGA